MLLLVLVPALLAPAFAAPRVQLIAPPGSDPRVSYGVERLSAALAKAGYEIHQRADRAVRVEVVPDASLRAEGYRILATPQGVRITGADAAGALYGCLELARMLGEEERLPQHLDTTASPSLALRGTCILLMKLGTYDYPITPKEFPFFYDRALWTEYLDFLARNRLNYIAFWNGHPFDYFVRLDKYPEAQAGMEPELLEKNHAMLMWLGREAERRNIWLMFQFYNIHTSVYFQKAHDLPAWNPKPTPLLADYTARSIERFVSEFPSVGLYICPGEALQLEYTDDWINNVIFPAVRRTGKNPPIMARAWGIDLPHMKKVVGSYNPLFTERKFNFEMIAGTAIDPENMEWARLSGNHVVNIHCIANLEPFRWSPPSYIQKIVRNSIAAGATGLHLYPRKAWRWPYGCDRGAAQELQWRRDWMWFETWARYAWDAARDPAAERAFWLKRLAKHFGSAPAARHLLDSQEAAADVLPGLQRVVWLHYDNHHVISAGILLDQFEKAGGAPYLADPGFTRIPAYLASLGRGGASEGVSPLAVLDAKVREAEQGLAAARRGAREARLSQDEAGRLVTDAEAVLLAARYYRQKLAAAAARARWKGGIEPRKNAAECLEQLGASLASFRELARLTSRTYESASDVPIWYPVRFKPDIVPYHWSDVLPYMEEEFVKLKREMAPH